VPAPDTDRALIDRANRGDADAFEALYHRYCDWVLSVAYRYTGDRDDALDVLQETFAYLFGKFPGFVPTAQLTTFLFPVVRNLSIDRLRKRRPSVDVDDLADVLPAPDAGSSNADLHRLLQLLPATQREVLLLRFVDDLSLQQIADALGVPLGTVKSRLHNALESMRKRTTDEHR
jgi:RNA polymerase sigma-70 factor (ECF subfamily)